MASSSLGTSSLKSPGLDFGRKVNNLAYCGSRTCAAWRPLKYPSLAISQRSRNLVTLNCCQSLETLSASKSEPCSEEPKVSGSISRLIPTLPEVGALITKLCDTSSVTELEIKLKGFRLLVVREIAEKQQPAPSPIPATTSVNANYEPPDSNGSPSTTSLALTKVTASSPSEVTLASLEKAAAKGLVVVKSPKVGYFRRSRTIKGKKIRPACKEKQTVKEGQVICYIDQLGGDIPVQSDAAGEVVKILRRDGDPVGYGDALVAILPSFSGIKKLQ